MMVSDFPRLCLDELEDCHSPQAASPCGERFSKIAVFPISRFSLPLLGAPANLHHAAQPRFKTVLHVRRGDFSEIDLNFMKAIHEKST